MRKTKIVVTIGPATSSSEMIKNLILGGVNVFRLNFSHGDHLQHKDTIKMIRDISLKLDREVAILADISGPKIRIGKIDGVLKLKSGDRVILSKESSNKKGVLTLSYPSIIDMVDIDDEIYFSDGTIKGIIIDKSSNHIELKLLNSGELTSFKGVNFPKTKLNISAITQKDRDDIIFCSQNDIDIIALSFIQNRNDTLLAKEIMKEQNFNPFIISKIETAQAINNLKEILEVSDGVMVARGDLGAEFGVTKLPRIQKHIISMANHMNRVSITATQMLSSMKEHPFPTRAEVSDIANAVYDGTDAVMLSDETAVGKYPIQAIEVLHDTIKDVEIDYPYFKDFKTLDSSDALSKSAVELAKNLNKEALVPFTTTGKSAQALSRYRPKQSIYAVSHTLETHRKLNLIWGVRPLFVMNIVNNPTKLTFNFVKKLLEEGRIDRNKRFIVTMGSVTGKMGSTNLIRILNREGMEAVLASEL